MSHSDQESPQDLAAAYALGALEPGEARRFEAFLAGSPEAQREVAEFREVAALLALGEADTAPGANLRDRVLARVGGEKTRALPVAEPTARRRIPWLMWGALAASLALAVGLAAEVLSQRQDLADLKGEVANRDQVLAERLQQLRAREATLNALMEPGVELYQLSASGDPEPGIQLFWNREKNVAIVHGFRLKPVPSGHAYQLWFIEDGKPVPSVTFKPEPSGHAKVEGVTVPTAGELSAAAITVEPEGGSPQPTSPILLVGSLQKKS
ncbi:MAG TPA: anti-sigma factor [Gemmatimonadales bacterium]|jgi:anti-sigma-K factor RskA